LCDLAAKDRYLMAQHQDLGVLGYGVHAVERQGLDDPAEQTGEKAERHGRAGSPLRSCLVKSGIALLNPFRSTEHSRLGATCTFGRIPHMRPGWKH
jgi:hypothetical protein